MSKNRHTTTEATDSFAVRYRVYLIVAWASVLILTFLGRDCYLDNQKEIKDEKSNQRQLLQVREDILEVRLIVENAPERLKVDPKSSFAEDVAQRVPPGNSESIKTKLGPFKKFMRNDLALRQDDMNQTVSAAIETIEQSDEASANILRGLLSRYNQLQKSACDKTIIDVSNYPCIARTTAYLYFSNSLLQTHRLEVALIQAEHRVIHELKSAEDKAQAKYEHAKWASWLIFGFSLGLGIFGKIKGVSLTAD